MEKRAKIKPAGSVVGKISMVLVALAFAAVGVAWSVRDPWVSEFSIGTACIVILWLGHRLINFAEKHPEAASMEAAESLVHGAAQQNGMEGATLLDGTAKTWTAESDDDALPSPLLPVGDITNGRKETPKLKRPEPEPYQPPEPLTEDPKADA
jgi:hypothetical protein